MDVGPPAVLLAAPLGDGQPLAPLTGRLVIWTPDQVARAELLVWALGSLALALIIALSLWLLVERRRRRRAERELFARLAVLEADRARAQIAAAGGPAAPRRRGIIPLPPGGGGRASGR